MNRMEFMAELESLLQDIPAEERIEAIRYYNNYFDDAGPEMERQILWELGDPSRAAAEVKAGLGERNEASGEYRETGYAAKEPPRTSRILKVVLIILIVLVGAPIVFPVGAAVLGVIFGALAVVFMIFLAFVIAAFAFAAAGVAVFCVGVINVVPEFAAGLTLMGIGMILTVLGVIGLVASVKLCVVAIPGIIRGIVWICRKPFHGREAVAQG